MLHRLLPYKYSYDGRRKAQARMELSPRAKIKQEFNVFTANLEPFTYLSIYTHM
jgi:hypothetical protein